jgi:hypothetical protein
MVTAAAILALSGIMAPEPLAARPRHHVHVAPQVETATPRSAVAVSAVPLPQPRPAEAPPRSSTEVAKGKDAPTTDDGKENAKDGSKQETAGPPPPSACRLALTDEIAIAPSVPAIHGPGACGGDDLVRLEAVVLPDKTRVALTPAGIMRCTMATAVVNWIRNDVAPEVAKLGSQIRTLDNFDSYECRGRNGIAGAHLSEHGHANAIDVHGFRLADGRMVELTDRTQPREFREAVLHSACTRFPTVLGPNSDGYHEDHIHLDLIERRSNYRICQWDVLDPLPKVAPLLPEKRPEDAPPREVAQTAGPADKVKGQAGAKAGDDKSDKPAKQEAGSSTGNATTGELSAPPKPASSAAPAVKTPAETTGRDKPENRPATAPKAVDAQPAPDKPSAAKPAEQASTAKTEKRASEKSPSEAAASEKSGSDKASGKPSRRKAAEDKPRRRRHRARAWNPFASFF